MQDWRIVAASVVGATHRAIGTFSQDNFGASEIPQFNGIPVLVAVVADGAGSAEHSATGAEAAIDAFRDCVFAYLMHSEVADANQDDVRRWLRVARDAVLQAAAMRSVTPRQLACTFLGAVVSPSKALFVQIGDGVMAYKIDCDQKWLIAINPQRGKYRNETFFITDDNALAQANIYELDGCLSFLALTTDGLEDLCMDRATSSPYQPFFDAIFSTIQSAGPEVPEHDLERALEKYLDSDAVNEITGDDKTLVLACR